MSKKKKKVAPKKKRKSASVKPKGMVQVTSPVRPEVAFYVASEMADDTAVEAELTGQVSRTMVYEFESKGNVVRGLSKYGVDETVRRINRNPASGSKIRISPEPPIINRDVEQNGQKGLEVMVYAEDLVTGGGAWGSKFEPYSKVGKKGSYPNEFAFEKALSKAQRNAKRSLIPEQAAIAIINKMIKEKGAVAQIEAPREVTIEYEPQATPAGSVYGAAMKRVQQISKDKAKLQEALKKVDAMPGLQPDQRERIKQEINDHLKNL